MTPFESGVVLVLLIEAVVCLVSGLFSGKGRFAVAGLVLAFVMVLVRLLLHLSVEWVP